MKHFRFNNSVILAESKEEALKKLSEASATSNSVLRNPFSCSLSETEPTESQKKLAELFAKTDGDGTEKIDTEKLTKRILARIDGSSTLRDMLLNLKDIPTKSIVSASLMEILKEELGYWPSENDVRDWFVSHAGYKDAMEDAIEAVNDSKLPEEEVKSANRSEKTEEVIDELDGLFTSDTGTDKQAIDTDRLTEAIMTEIDNTMALYKAALSNRIKAHSIVWMALMEIVKDSTNFRPESGTLKMWFKDNGTDYAKALAPAVKETEEYRRRIQKEVKDAEKKNKETNEKNAAENK